MVVPGEEPWLPDPPRPPPRQSRRIQRDTEPTGERFIGGTWPGITIEPGQSFAAIHGSVVTDEFGNGRQSPASVMGSLQVHDDIEPGSDLGMLCFATQPRSQSLGFESGRNVVGRVRVNGAAATLMSGIQSRQ